MLPFSPKRSRRGFVWKLVGACLWSAGTLIPHAPAGITVDPALPPATAASVNAQPIPRQLVETFLKNDREALGLTAQTEEQRAQLARLPAAILDELIDRTLIAQEARKRGVAADDARLDADEARLIAFCGNEARYAAYTAQSGFDRPQYRENVLRPAADGQAMVAELTRDLAASDDEIKTYYEAHGGEADFQFPERVTGEHILVGAQRGQLASRLEASDGLQVDTPEMDEAVKRETGHRRERAESIRQQAAAPGADFAALAKKYSDDLGTRDQSGSLATFAHGVHPLALDDAFFALKPGEIGPVVATEYGFHIIRITARLPAGRRSLEEAAPEIRRRLLREKSARRLREWLAETRDKAAVTVHDAHDLPEAK